MKICPECHDEFRDDIEICFGCHVTLKTYVNGSTPLQSKEEEKVNPLDAVRVFEGQLPACKEMQSQLKAHRIGSMMAPVEEKPGTYFLLINSSKLERYAEMMRKNFEEMVFKENSIVLNSSEVHLDGNDVTCPACGFVGALTEGQCQECGLFLGVNE